ncbi:hypothetical protein [Oceanirhabdus sp. W0125-5]|uniref:hypothetical protein n=1 Tax=Oceanirhabdus sp. W0125-5 TaxID=2999116 RepID=UPI0022F2F77A|nr:hypothetical protein [Oceanirhabdus sp. W0125-5]WBW95356.1 hypothetical protein OW730_16875 [Oceanirhabdus sp. W0125-5]
MIVVDKKNIVMGSNALESSALPEVAPKTQKKKKSEVKKHIYIQEHKAYKRKRNIMTFGCISLFFVLGMITVGRYNLIFEQQKKIERLKSEYKSYQFKNDNLKLSLAKGFSLNELEDYSIKNLQMKAVDKEDCTYADLSKDHFANPTVKSASSQKGIFDKLVKLLF